MGDIEPPAHPNYAQENPPRGEQEDEPMAAPSPEAKSEILRSGLRLEHLGQGMGSSRSLWGRSSSKSSRQSGQWYSKMGIVACLVILML